MKKLQILLAALSVVALSGCSGGGDMNDGSGTMPAPKNTTTTTTPGQPGGAPSGVNANAPSNAQNAVNNNASPPPPANR